MSLPNWLLKLLLLMLLLAKAWALSCVWLQVAVKGKQTVPQRDLLCCQNETAPCEEVEAEFETADATAEVAEAASHAAFEVAGAVVVVAVGGGKVVAAAAVVVEVACEPLPDGNREDMGESHHHVRRWGLQSTWTPSSPKTTTSTIGGLLVPLTWMSAFGCGSAVADRS